MKSPTAVVDDCDDIFGPPRTYPTGYCPPKNRPSMISAKYRQKEERRKVLKISMNKMKKIEDPELSLCRSVLINNTMKRLQREARDEKVLKQQLNYPRCYDNDSIATVRAEFAKNENKNTINDFADEQPHAKPHHQDVEFVVENDFDTKLAEEIKTVTAKNMDIEFGLTAVVARPPEPIASRKRSFDEMEDCDVQDVLSQFYMPPTPRMLTCIDEDEDVVAVAEPKRPKLLEATEDKTQDFTVNSFLNNNNLPHQQHAEPRLRYTTQSEADPNPYSCGHASMFSELQSNVYHNLIASLET